MYVSLSAVDPTAQFYEGPEEEVFEQKCRSKFVILSGLVAVDRYYIGYAQLYDLDGMQFETAVMGTKTTDREKAEKRIPQWVQQLVDSFNLTEVPCPYTLD